MTIAPARFMQGSYSEVFVHDNTVHKVSDPSKPFESYAAALGYTEGVRSYARSLNGSPFVAPALKDAWVEGHPQEPNCYQVCHTTELVLGDRLDQLPYAERQTSIAEAVAAIIIAPSLRGNSNDLVVGLDTKTNNLIRRPDGKLVYIDFTPPLYRYGESIATYTPEGPTVLSPAHTLSWGTKAGAVGQLVVLDALAGLSHPREAALQHFAETTEWYEQFLPKRVPRAVRAALPRAIELFLLVRAGVQAGAHTLPPGL